MKPLYYTLKNKKVVPCDDAIEWAKSLTKTKIIVKQETINGDYISTVFLGIDHGWGEELLVFETMIFSEHEEISEYQKRYSTWEQAEVGHKEAVDLVKKYKQGDIDNMKIPILTLQGLNNYLNFGIEAGDFLKAVLCNDLKQVCARADIHNRYALFDIVQFLYNKAPIGSWGSEENYNNYLNKVRSKDDGR
jgi:transcriptional regulator